MSTTAGETRLFRGASLDEILPRIREELGPDAVVLREREGVVGGIAGFFARRCIEVEAAPGWPSSDEDTVLTLPAYQAAGHYGELDLGVTEPTNSFMEALLDRAAALDELFVPAGAATDEPSAEERIGGQHGSATSPGSDVDDDLLPELHGPAVTDDEPTPAAPAGGPSGELDDPRESEVAVRMALAEAGMGSGSIESLMERVRDHLQPLAPGASVRQLSRLALRSSLSTPLGWAGRRTIGFVGLDDAPAVQAVAALAVAQASTSARVAVVALGGGRPAARLAALLVDTDVDVLLAHDVHDVERAIAQVAAADLVLAVGTEVTADDDRSTVAAAALLLALDPDETHLVVPVGGRPDRLRRVLDELDAYVAVDCLLPCASGLADELGGAVGVAIERRLALRWVASEGTAVHTHAADPVMLAEALLP